MAKNINLWLVNIAIVFATVFGLFSLSRSNASGDNSLPLEITWQLTHYSTDSQSGDTFTNSEFIIKNISNKTIELKPFWVMFNCMAGVVEGEKNGTETSHINGTFYKVSPSNNTIKISAHGEYKIPLLHRDLLQTISKAPQGPFLVYKSNPEKSHIFAKSSLIPLMRAQNFDGAPKWFSTAKPLAKTFEENAEIQNIELAKLPPVYPIPSFYKYGDGKLLLSGKPQIFADANLATLSKYAKSLFNGKPIKTQLRLSLSNDFETKSPEGYSVKISKNGIEIKGRTKAGVFYGLKSLEQIITQNTKDGVTALPYLEIIDAPRFEYRGLLIDIARNYKPVEKLHQTLEIMADLKLNKLHLHLSDDEGWRVEIKAIPELTKIGAKRGHSNDVKTMLSPAYGSGAKVITNGGSGFYSQSQYVALLKHAAELNIEIIPEIEMPGHARAAVKAMEARYNLLKNKDKTAATKYLLSDLEDKSKYRSAQLYSDNVINPALDSTYAFAEAVIGEFAAMHKKAGVPLRRIHLGADELGTGAWEKSPAVAALMAKLNTNDTADVWNYFYGRMNEIAAKNGAKIAGWEELGMRKMPKGSNPRIIPNSHFKDKNFLLFIWNNLEGSEDWAYQLANMGYEVVLAPVTNFYFDMMHERDGREPGHDWSRAIGMREVFEFDPYKMTSGINGAQTLNENAKVNIKGIEATMFSETMMNDNLHDYLLFPRIFGLSERAWSQAPEWQMGGNNQNADWSRFVGQMSKQFLSQVSGKYKGLNYRIPSVGAIATADGVKVNHQYGFDIYYTVNGKAPTQKSKKANGLIKEKGLLKIAAIAPNGKSGPVIEIENK